MRTISFFILSWIITIVVMPILFVRGMYRAQRNKHSLEMYIRNIAIAHDQLWSAAIGWNPDITVSDGIGRKRNEGDRGSFLFCKILNFVFMQKDHCNGAREHDEEKEQN